MSLASSLFLTQNFKLWRKNLYPIHSSTSLQYQNLLSALKSCENTNQVSQIHGFMIKAGFHQDSFALSKLLAVSIQDIQYAASIFKHIQNRNLFVFNTMLRAYSISHNPKQAFGVFSDLRAQGFTLDQFSFVATLKSCARESSIETGQGIHGIVLRSGHLLFINVKNTLLHVYALCGQIENAHKLFDEFPQWNDLVSWNTLMRGYLHVSQPNVVTILFKEMYRSGLGVSVTALLSILSAIGDLEDSFGGESLHAQCIKTALLFDLNVVTALIDMYARIGHIDLVRSIFDNVTAKDVIIWNCMIDKFAKSGLLEESVALLEQMRCEKVKPNSSTLVGLLSACAASGSADVGRRIGDYVEEEELALDAVLGTSLVDMYAKFGFLEKAVDIFKKMSSKDVKSWTAMISGYGTHGLAGNAIELFYKMERKGCRPNEVTFLAVLNACSHGGMVVEGMRCFERMVQEYGFMPKVEHYGCVIDLLGRAGLLKEAYNLITKLPIKDDSTAWRSLLAACRVYGDVSLGERVKSVLDKLDDALPADLMLLFGTYAIAGRLADQRRLEEEKDTANRSLGKKEAGCSTIEMGV
ncbi:pentatricopeptide repeat-containing protein At1g26900, mitochondrial [Carica papaya]|uniref:pentatricopeptide repeat-containing protein At1g26900, mitochondrial n=1 Tax=Carica papaya TaxID=3649 RepID=UPI000B8CEDE8|nr:pentatricopeptide repeat-containing protein At1g26900, mitochondrial [Carica papaya]